MVYVRLCVTFVHPTHLLQIIFCAAARTTITADLLRVDNGGVINIAKAMQVRISLELHDSLALCKRET